VEFILNIKKHFIVMLTLLQSFNALATLSPEQKELQVAELGSRRKGALPAANVEAYQRALHYDQFNIPVEERAKRETNLMAEKIKTQISLVYQNALAETGNEDLANQAVRAKLEVDLALVAPELRNDIREISLNALEESQNGIQSNDTIAPSIEANMMNDSQDQANLLNSGFMLLRSNYQMGQIGAKAVIVNPNIKDGNTTEYKSKKELIDSLTSTETSAMGGYLSSNMSINSSKATSFGGSVSYRVRVKFMGVDLSAGPVISFSRNYSTSVGVSGDNLTPLLTKDGQFDFYVRDSKGKIVNGKNGKPEKRYLTFGCNAELSFGTNYNGSGGFSIVGVGGDTYVSRNYNNSVDLNSRRVVLPEYIEGKSVTLGMLASLCNNEFVNSKIMNNMTLKDSLNLMMKDMISSLVFSHPNTKCVTDRQCDSWFKKDIRPVSGTTAVPRCLEEKREHFMTCYARGVVGTKCPIFKDHKLISDGAAEYTCDKGLTCKKIKEYGWFKNYQMFQYAEGRCTK
jgi:hypothetical protein